ncbi:hypothetical protein QTP88_025772 [Uroleucon formosanum]
MRRSTIEGRSIRRDGRIVSRERSFLSDKISGTSRKQFRTDKMKLKSASKQQVESKDKLNFASQGMFKLQVGCDNKIETKGVVDGDLQSYATFSLRRKTRYHNNCSMSTDANRILKMSDIGV